MRGLLFVVMMLAMVPMASNAREYINAEGDWAIYGAREGQNMVCGMGSQRPSDIKFLYMFSTGISRGPVKVFMRISTTLPPGTIDAVIKAGSSEPIILKGVVSKNAVTFDLRTDTRSNQTQRVRDAILEESTLKITLNRQGTPPDTITVSLDGASDALVSMTKCARSLVGLDE